MNQNNEGRVLSASAAVPQREADAGRAVAFAEAFCKAVPTELQDALLEALVNLLVYRAMYRHLPDYQMDAIKATARLFELFTPEQQENLYGAAASLLVDRAVTCQVLTDKAEGGEDACMVPCVALLSVSVLFCALDVP